MNNAPSIYEARAYYNDFGAYVSPPTAFFSKYSPAYTTSNEPLRWEISLTPNPKDVLTVAGSGDQALFYSISGAKHIDTFDISYCAHVIQDIKTTAIRNKVPYYDYRTLLQDLHRRSDVMEVQEIIPILNKIPQDSLDFLINMRGCRIFDIGENPFFSYNNIPFRHYKKMSHTIPESFNFIWSDILNLHTKLNRTYDVINLSNIFDYLTTKERSQIVSNLYPFLNMNGCIIFCECHADYDKEKMTSRKILNVFSPSSFTKMMLLQKIK